MNIHPIKTESDYEQALSEVEKLWGAEEGTKKGDKLDILLVLMIAMRINITQSISPILLKR